MRYQSSPVNPEERQETTSERAERQRQSVNCVNMLKAMRNDGMKTERVLREKAEAPLLF